MAKLKPILKAVTDASGAVKRPLRSQPLQGDLGPLDDLGEYQRVAGELDEATAASPTPQAVREEIARQEAETFEATRLDRISRPDAETGTFHTHRTPDEYRARLDAQLRDPEYSVRSIIRATTGIEGFAKQDVDRFAASVRKSQEVEAQFQERVVGKAMENPRYKQAVDNYNAEGAYGNQVMIHIDRQVDPHRAGSDDFVQFENAPEFGIHSGTNLAAERATIKDADFEIRRQARLDEDINIAAQALEMTPSEFGGIIARAMNAHFLKRFQSGKKTILTGEFAEVRELLEEAMLEMGVDTGMAGKIIGDMKSMSTASTTPHYFRGKNGLYLDDTGSFRSNDVANQLLEIFPDDFDAIHSASSGSNLEATKKLQDFIESKGYDHIVYHNAVEDKGQLSIINWNPDLMKTIWDDDFIKGNPATKSTTVVEYLLGTTGLGSATIRDE